MSSIATERDVFNGSLEIELPFLHRFAARFAKSRADQEDLVHDTIVKALHSSHLFQPGTAFRSWLFTILRNTFNTKYTRGRREIVGLDDEYVSKAVTAAPQEWAVRSAELQAVLTRMSPKSRETLLLVTSGVSYIDAARICDCEIGTIKSRVNRARTALLAELGPVH